MMKANGTSGHKFSAGELESALRDFENLMERVLCDYVVLGDVAKAIRDGTDLYGDKVEVGMFKLEVTKFVLSTLKTLLPDIEIGAKGFSYKFHEVPVEVKIIGRKYKFFEHPDFRFYKTGNYKFANPFENYWKARYLIR